MRLSGETVLAAAVADPKIAAAIAAIILQPLAMMYTPTPS